MLLRLGVGWGFHKDAQRERVGVAVILAGPILAPVAFSPAPGGQRALSACGFCQCVGRLVTTQSAKAQEERGPGPGRPASSGPAGYKPEVIPPYGLGFGCSIAFPKG